MVQVVEDRRKRIEYAIKFYLFRDAFEGERALYQDLSQPLGQFLPEVSASLTAAKKVSPTRMEVTCRHAL